MRAHAPCPVLLSVAALLLASVFLPATLLAKSPKKRAPRQAEAAHHPKAARPRSNVHKAGRHREPVSLRSPTHHPTRVERTSNADTAAEGRVHAWVKNQSAAADAATTPQGLTAPLPDPAIPTSVLSAIRHADTVGANKPQLLPPEQVAAEPVILPTLYNKRGRLIVPPALKGSHEILLHQNQMADSDGLDRIRDDEDLDRMRRAGTLVPLPADSTLHVDDRLPANRRYCRPWTALFLDTLARQHYAHFQTALQVNSAVRTVEFQQRLVHTNGNAAPAEGNTASPHLTGQAVDIAKRGLSLAEIAWLRGYLLPLVQQGKVDVEEEFQQSCFHISVYKKYMPSSAANRRTIATTHREGVGTLGMGLQ